MSLLTLIVNKIAYTIVKTAAGIKDQCCNCHANLSPAGRTIKGTMTMAQHTSAEMPKILRIIADFDLWDSFMPLNLSDGKNTLYWNRAIAYYYFPKPSTHSSLMRSTTNSCWSSLRNSPNRNSLVRPLSSFLSDSGFVGINVLYCWQR